MESLLAGVLDKLDEPAYVARLFKVMFVHAAKDSGFEEFLATVTLSG
jgi:hypothetical protein